VIAKTTPGWDMLSQPKKDHVLDELDAFLELGISIITKII
jgi:hypothetical protein